MAGSSHEKGGGGDDHHHLAGALSILLAAMVAGCSESDLAPSSENAHDSASLVDSAALPMPPGESWDVLDDPEQDGWATEVMTTRADRQLHVLAELIEQRSLGEDSLAPILDPSFFCLPLLPSAQREAFRDEALVVMRASASRSDQVEKGPAGLSGFLVALLSPFDTTEPVSVSFKTIRISREPEQNGFVTRELVTLSGKTSSQTSIEHHAKWDITWRGTEVPKMVSIRSHDVEQVTTTGPLPLFSDCTASVLGGNPCYREQLLVGFDRWLEGSQDLRFLYLLGNPGIAIGDANGDGMDDLFLCQERGLPNRLFLQQTDGTLTDVSVNAGVDWLENCRCALFLDLDNDGDQDLAVGVDGGVVIAENDGTAGFSLRVVLEAGADVISLSAADFDRDGRLDLYAGVYHPSDATAKASDALPAASGVTVYHDANNGGRNSLFRNAIAAGSSWKFVDVTTDSGMDENNRRFTLAASWEDFDDDGDQDLYVANDFGRNNLYRNDTLAGGTPVFKDIAAVAGVEDSASGMGTAWGDYDGDGKTDLYVSNMFSSAGNRITFQDQFKSDAATGVKERLQRFARGNTLFRNRGDATFEDRSLATAVNMGRWAWSSSFVDLNNDGWEDLVVGNGYITTEDSGDL